MDKAFLFSNPILAFKTVDFNLTKFIPKVRFIKPLKHLLKQTFVYQLITAPVI